MPDDEIREKLSSGQSEWNAWRQKGNTILRRALQNNDFTHKDYRGFDFSHCDLSETILRDRDFSNANFKGAVLNDSDFAGSRFIGANFQHVAMNRAHLNLANFQRAQFKTARIANCSTVQCDFRMGLFFNSILEQSGFLEAKFDNSFILKTSFNRSHFSGASFMGAKINNSSFIGANLVACNLAACKIMRTDFSGAFLTGAIFVTSRIERCRVYATSIWDVDLTYATQRALIITPPEASDISIDNMEVANFIYLLSNSAKLRSVIDTITSKVVLILGRFSLPNKHRLDELSVWLSKNNFVPVIFDFEKPASRDTSETVGLLARMARFVIADITDARSIPQELTDIVEKLPNVAVLPIIKEGHAEYGMFDHIKKYPWVGQILEFSDTKGLIRDLPIRLENL